MIYIFENRDKTEETSLCELGMLFLLLFFFYLHTAQMDLVCDFIYYLASLGLTTTRIWRLIALANLAVQHKSGLTECLFGIFIPDRVL